MNGDVYIKFENSSGEMSNKRRTVLKTLGGISLASLAGCIGGDDEDLDDSGLVEVHEVEFMGPAEGEGIEHDTARLAAESVDEHTPIPANYAPMRNSRMVELAFFDRTYDAWYSQSQARLGMLEPYLWSAYHHSRFDNCGDVNLAGILDDRLDEAVENQARALDRDERQQLVHEFYQDINDLDSDLPANPYAGVVHPMLVPIYNSELFENVFVQDGLGFKNYQNWNQITPRTDETTLITVHRRPSSNFNPLQSGYTNLAAHDMIYDKLMLLSADGTSIEPHVATDWEESEDGEVITITIRDDVTFHDGEPLTAEDVAFTYEYYENSGWYRNGIQQIEETEAIDETTVEITLEHSWAPIYGMAFARIPLIPKHIWENIPEESDADVVVDHPAWQTGDMIGSGPFEFVEWRPEEEARLVATDDHFTGGPEVDEIIMNIVADANAVLNELESGNSHILVDSPGANPETMMNLVEESGHLSGDGITTVANHFYAMNVDSAPLNFDAIRAAIQACIPRKEIIRELRGPEAEPNYDMAQPATEFWYTNEKKKWDLEDDGEEAAVEILEDAGFVIEDGTLYYPPGEAPESKELEGYGC